MEEQDMDQEAVRQLDHVFASTSSPVAMDTLGPSSDGELGGEIPELTGKEEAGARSPEGPELDRERLVGSDTSANLEDGQEVPSPGECSFKASVQTEQHPMIDQSAAGGSQALLDSLQKENAKLRSLQTELFHERSNLSHSMQEMGRELQSSSAENMRLRRQVEDFQRRGRDSDVGQHVSPLAGTDRERTAEEEARLAKAQLSLLLEKYDRIERDNQAMADEIHHFREEIGRLQQCSVQASGARSRYIAMGISILLGLAYIWIYLDDLL
ncbi:uncharacterized protein [Narcine bancroftii]|uniref:uncharacterized protein isoform X1 n=1 Tax=Narcine bancroftii TaxID=1343680 RepID=UPI003831A66B